MDNKIFQENQNRLSFVSNQGNQRTKLIAVRNRMAANNQNFLFDTEIEQHLQFSFGNICPFTQPKTRPDSKEQSLDLKNPLELSQDRLEKGQGLFLTVSTNIESVKKKKPSLKTSRKSRCFAKEHKLRKPREQKGYLRIGNEFESFFDSVLPMELRQSCFGSQLSARGGMKDNMKVKDVIERKQKQQFNFQEFLQHHFKHFKKEAVQKAKKFKQQLKENRQVKFQDGLKEKSRIYDGSSKAEDKTDEKVKTYIDSISTKLDLCIIDFEKSQKRVNRWKHTLKNHERAEAMIRLHEQKNQEKNVKNAQQISQSKEKLKRTMSAVSSRSLICKPNSERKGKDMSGNTSRLMCSQSARKYSKKQDLMNTEGSQNFNRASKTHKAHFSKLKGKCLGKMSTYEMEKANKKKDQKDKKAERNSITSNKEYFTVEASALVITREEEENQSSNCLDRGFKHQRPCTGLSRVGLEFNDKSMKKRSSSREFRVDHLTGVKSGANQFLTFSKKMNLKDIDTEEKKSDRVMRALKKNFGNASKSQCLSHVSSPRAQTSRQRNSRKISQVSTPKPQELTPKPQELLDFKNITRKQIEKEELKVKMWDLILDCEEEQYLNRKVKKGIDIFENYYDNIDEGLKEVTLEIDKYIGDTKLIG